MICKEKEEMLEKKDWYEELYEDAAKYGRSHAVLNSSNPKRAYEELYNEYPWEFEPGEW